MTSWVAVLAFAALLYTHNWSLYLFAVTAAAMVVWALVRRDRSAIGWIVLASARGRSRVRALGALTALAGAPHGRAVGDAADPR